MPSGTNSLAVVPHFDFLDVAELDCLNSELVCFALLKLILVGFRAHERYGTRVILVAVQSGRRIRQQAIDEIYMVQLNWASHH